jgi:hypothetical protein
MSADALFLHVVRSDMPEDETVETLLEWVAGNGRLHIRG